LPPLPSLRSRFDVLEASQSRTQRFDDSVDVIISIVRQLVDFDSWRFGRVQGTTVAEFACSTSDAREIEIKRFFECYRRQQRRIDPRAIAIVQDAAFLHAVTLTLTLSDGNDAMLVLLRQAPAAPFTEYEYRLLAQAKVLCEECLVSTRVAEDARESADAVTKRSKPMLFILDRSYKIVMGHRLDPGDEAVDTGFSEHFVDRLPKVFEDAVRELTKDWMLDPSVAVDAVTMPLPFLSLRVHGMSGPSEQFLAITIERMRRRNVLLRAAKQFLITPREREVAGFLLDGLRIEEIGERLRISTSTVNDHVKKLVERTGAANRSQMLARLLGWGPRSGAATQESRELGMR
jgi:DNA-binding CsgD family transcriptional regulator